jgi:hypothetical protein
VNAPNPPRQHDLTDDDVVSRPLEPAVSPLAMTGIDFRGLERLESIPILEWKDARRKRPPVVAK